MEIFRIRLDVNVYQRFLPADQSFWQMDNLRMDCTPKLPDWRAPEIYIHNPKRKQGNFYYLSSGSFVVDSQTAEQLRSILEMSGELLPLEHAGNTYYLLNILECVNCLDQQKTKWVVDEKAGVKVRILEHHFHRQRLVESTIFKIPETAAGDILCVEGLKDPEDEFKAQVEACGFTGLLFDKLWSDQP